MPRRTRNTPRVPTHIVLLTLAIGILAPIAAATEDLRPKPYEKEFIITAYYSPVADQCCYVRGGEVADKILNGQGVKGADGTGVYPGMAAAPGTYAFGTRIRLPGIGTVTVHDRGGAIQVTENGDRLDLWFGYGEEGLARALAFGVKRVRGTVYPRGSEQPPERMVFAEISAPLERLQPFLTLDRGLLDARPKANQYSYSVLLLQERLHDAGYFDHERTGKFGAVTQQALQSFLDDMRLAEPADRLTERSAAYLVAAAQERRSADAIPYVNAGSSAADVSTAQRLLRFLGFYRGRTDGDYDDGVRDAIFAFQKARGLAGTMESPGAGRIGPLTQKQLFGAWSKRRIAQRAEKMLLFSRVRSVLAKRGDLPDRFLELGYSGPAVRAYQEFLAERGYFPADKINGSFGPLTRDATIEYQLAEGLIKRRGDEGAGEVGPLTLRHLRLEEMKEAYILVRGFGLNVL